MGDSAFLKIMAKSGGKINLKDKLDGNELDLSLCDLNEVPVKDLVSICFLIYLRKKPAKDLEISSLYVL